MKQFVHYLTLVILAALLSSCGKSEAKRISSVLDQCAKISQKAGSLSRDPGIQAQYIAEEFQKVDVRRCPEDFRVAYQSHVFAWQQAVPFFQNNNFGTNFLEGLVAGLARDPSHLGAASGQAALASAAISSTYRDLTLIAAYYGASIPTSVVGR